MICSLVNLEFWTVIFAGAVALSTIVYVILTATLVYETRKMRKNQIDPYMVAYLDIAETKASIIYLKTKNIGLGVALNVNFKIIKELESNDARKLMDYPYFKDGVKYFPPNHEDKHLLVAFGSDNEAKATDSIIFEIEYESILKERKRNRYELNLKEIVGKGNLVPPDTHIGNISYRLEKIQQLLEKKLNIAEDKRLKES